MLYPSEDDKSCKPALLCKLCRLGKDAEPPGDKNYAALALDHVLHGSRSGSAGRWISTTASLGVAQRFSGQLFAPVALIYIGDMPDADANSKVRNLTNENCLRSLQEEAQRPSSSHGAPGVSQPVVVDMVRFQRLQTRAKRSQEVLVFGTIPAESVRILTPSIVGGTCCVWPYDPDCARRLGNGFTDIAVLLGSHGPPQRLPSGREAVPQAMELLRPLCGSNDGLSIVRIAGKDYLLKRAKPNVEDDAMLSAAEMRVQLQACWAANNIHGLVTGRGDDFGCSLYEYESFFADFKDPEYESFTWPDAAGSVNQVWQGSFILFSWPEDSMTAEMPFQSEESESGAVEEAKCLLADCLLGVSPHAALEARRRAVAADTDSEVKLTFRQRDLVEHVLKLDFCFGCLAIERTKRSDAFSQTESLLQFLTSRMEPNESNEVSQSFSDPEEQVQRLVIGLSEVLSSRHVTGLAVQIVKVASLLDLQPLKTEIHTKLKTSFEACMRCRLDLLRDLEGHIQQRSPCRCGSSVRSLSLNVDSRSLSGSSKHGGSTRDLSESLSPDSCLSFRVAVREVLEQECNRCAVLFAEPLCSSNGQSKSTKISKSSVGQNCVCSQYLSNQIHQDQSLKSKFLTSLEVGTSVSFIEAARNHSILILNTYIEVESGLSVSTGSPGSEVRFCLEMESISSLVEWNNHEWHTFYLDDGSAVDRGSEEQQGRANEVFYGIQSSGLKVLLLIDSSSEAEENSLHKGSDSLHTKGSVRKRTQTICASNNLNFFLIVVRASAAQLSGFVVNFLKGLSEGKEVGKVFASVTETTSFQSAQLWTPQAEMVPFIRQGNRENSSTSTPAYSLAETSLKSMYAGAVFNEILAETVRRIENPHISPFHLFFEEISVHLHVFTLWSKRYEDHAVEVLNIFGRKGDSILSQLASELAQYLFFRPKLGSMLKLSGVKNPSDLILQLTEDCSERELLAILETEHDTSEPAHHQLMLIDAQRLKSPTLQKLFSFPSEVLNAAKEQNIRLVIFHSEERSLPESQSCIRPIVKLEDNIIDLQMSTRESPYDRGELQSILFKIAHEDKCPWLREELSDPILDHYFAKRTSGLMAAEEARSLMEYVLDIEGTSRRMPSVVSGGAFHLECGGVIERFLHQRREAISDDKPDEAIQSLLQSVLQNLNKHGNFKKSMNASTVSQILRIVSLLDNAEATQLVSLISSSTDLSIEMLLGFVFSIISPELQQALIFFATLPEGISLDDQILEPICKLDQESTTCTDMNRSFWMECWLSALILETSATGEFYRLGGRFPHTDRPELSLFQWLHNAGFQAYHSGSQRSATFLLMELVKRGFATTDGNTFAVVSVFRVFCESKFQQYSRESRYIEFVRQRELQICERLLCIFNCQQDASACTNMLTKHAVIWTWAMDRMTEAETRNSNKCMMAAHLLWAVRRGVRVFYEADSDDTEPDLKQINHCNSARMRNWSEMLHVWAELAADFLSHAADEAGDSGATLIAAAMCRFIQAHASHGRNQRKALECCSQADIVIRKAKINFLKANPMTLESHLCVVEVVVLCGRILSEKKQQSEVDSVFKARVDKCKEMLVNAYEKLRELIEIATEYISAASPVNVRRVEATRTLSNLSMLRCELLNNLGNLCMRHPIKDFKGAKEYFQQAMEASRIPLDMPNFYSHSLGLAILQDFEKQAKSTNMQAKNDLLISAAKHLRHALEVRSRLAHSKSYKSILRLCDTHRTLHRVLAHQETVLRSAELDDLAVHRGRLMTLGMLQRCARTWDDRSSALQRLCLWMSHVGVFKVPQYPILGRYSVDLQWDLSTNLAEPVKQNQAFFRLGEPANCAKAELSAEMLRALTALRLESLEPGTAVDFLLDADPAASGLCKIAGDCASNRLPASLFIAAVATVRALTRGRDCGLSVWDRKWRGLIVESLRAFVGVKKAPANQVTLPSSSFESAATCASPSPVVWTADSNGEEENKTAVDMAYVHRPAAYVARLVHLRKDDLSADLQRAILRTALAATSGWAAVQSWAASSSGRMTRAGQGGGEVGSRLSQAYKEVLLVWLAATSQPVRAHDKCASSRALITLYYSIHFFASLAAFSNPFP